jgi:hypothetical protein
MRFQSQRVDQPSDIINLPLLNTEFVKNKVWVDTNNTGDWAVYRKSLNYSFDLELLKSSSTTFGSAVATTSDLGYLVGDASAGTAYRYVYNPVFQRYDIVQTLIGDASFGSSIAYYGSIFAVSQPTGALITDRKIKVYNLVVSNTENELQLTQTILAPAGVTNWGNKIEFSGDGNWLYISAYVENEVYVYVKSQVTGLYEYRTYITVGGLISGDNFGYSIATNYYGNTLTIGAPEIDTGVINNTGKSYIYERLFQNFEAQVSSQIYVPQLFTIAWTPVTATQTATATAASTDRITVTSSDGFAVGDAVVFTGTLLSAGAIAANTVYYVLDKPTGTTFRANQAIKSKALIFQEF